VLTVVVLGRISASQVKSSVIGQIVIVLVEVTTIVVSASGRVAYALRNWSGKRAGRYFRDLIMMV